MRSRASSQEVSRHASSVRTSRRRGRRTRIGLSMISREAWPRMQRKPRLSGFSSSPRMLSTRSSWISTSIPQYVGWQFMGHMVRTRRISWLGGRSLPVIGLFSLLAFATTLARRTTFAEPGAIQSRHPRQVQGSSGPSASTVAPFRVLASAPPSWHLPYSVFLSVLSTEGSLPALRKSDARRPGAPQTALPARDAPCDRVTEPRHEPHAPTRRLHAFVRRGACAVAPAPSWDWKIPRVCELRTRRLFQGNFHGQKRHVRAGLAQHFAFRRHQPAATGKRLTVVGPAIGGGDKASGHHRRHARSHRPTPVSAGRPRRRNEMRTAPANLPRWFGEQQFRAELKAHGQRPYSDGGKLAVPLRKPSSLPAIGFVREIVLGMRTPIAPVPRPAKGLIEALSVDLHRARGKDKCCLECREPGDGGVMGGEGRFPHGEINGLGHEHPPVTERHLGQHDYVCRACLKKADQLGPGGFVAAGLIGKLTHRNLHPVSL